MPVLAHPLRELARGRKGRGRVIALDLLDGELRAAVERLRDPALRRRHADAEAVVLAHEEQRQRLPSVGEMRRRVERGLRGRVVERRVSERADDHGVGRPGARDPELARPLDRERDTHRAGEVRGNRRGLRDHGEVVMPEHLVAAAGDRLVGRGGHPEEDVPHPVPPCLPRPREVEATRAVVEKRRVGRPQRERDERVRLVPGRPDRVEAEPPGLQPTRRMVDRAALDLGAPGRRGFDRDVGRALGGRQPAQRVDEMLLERVEIGAHDPGKVSAHRSQVPQMGGCGARPLQSILSSDRSDIGSSRGPQRRRPDRSPTRGTWSPSHVLRHFRGPGPRR